MDYFYKSKHIFILPHVLKTFLYLTLEQPSKPEIVSKAPFLETEQLKKVRTCV